ncbi:TolC family protein [Acidipila rosea]|uniref:Outer membrane protein TolC n=1 Tax=Acidipila rosea TaxID=768535 RepID=A0A4V2PV07_9BACT|nr:TolC family protein [Acidipila rosea]TCK71861.1 outer membrane protein TolC [Acidipila rosea]
MASRIKIATSGFWSALRLAALLAASTLFLSAPPVTAQTSFNSAIGLALKSDPRIKLAEDDVHKAEVNLETLKAAFVPSISGNIGAGPSYGITTSVPTIFTLHAQSLIMNSSQLGFIRAAHAGIDASKASLRDIKEQVEEDVAISYLSLCEAQEKNTVLEEELEHAQRLATILEERVSAGENSEMELKQTRRTLLQVQLQRLQGNDQMASLRNHLSQLLGIPTEQLEIASSTIPPVPSFDLAGQNTEVHDFDTPSIVSAEADAHSKSEQARADSHYTWRPQIGFAAEYGRISPFNGASTYYNLNGNYNTAYAAVQVQIPFFDKTHKANARAALIEAQHAAHTVQLLRDQQQNASVDLRHSIEELSVKEQLAVVDQGLANDQLNIVLVQLQAGSGRKGVAPMTPIDEQKARIQERIDYMGVLDDRLQLQESEIRLLRQTGSLQNWIDSAISSATPSK